MLLRLVLHSLCKKGTFLRQLLLSIVSRKRRKVPDNQGGMGPISKFAGISC